MSGLNAKIKHLEEYIMKTTVDLKHLKELKDTVANDNEKVKWDIATLSKEKDIALARYIQTCTYVVVEMSIIFYAYGQQ